MYARRMREKISLSSCFGYFLYEYQICIYQVYVYTYIKVPPDINIIIIYLVPYYYQ